MQFNGVGGELWLGLCRAQLGGEPEAEGEAEAGEVDPTSELGWTVGLFHMSDFPLFGQCVVKVITTRP